MKILFIIPINRSYVVMPYLGVGYLARIAMKMDHEVQVLNCLKDSMSFELFEEYIKKNNFDIIGFPVFTQDINPVRKHVAIIKKHQPESIVLIGGPHPSGDPVGCLELLHQVDFGFAGEAEIGFEKLLQDIRKHGTEISEEQLRMIPGLIWRKDDGIELNEKVFVEDLDTIDFPAWELMDPSTYPEAPHGAFSKSFPTIPIIITRGCPFECTFCAGKMITGRRVRKRSIDNVLKEIDWLISEFDIHEYLIEDENFTLHKKMVHEFCDKVIERNLKIHWSFPSGVRLDTLDEDMLKKMEKAGCHSLSVGIEFGSQRIHDLTKKKLKLDLIKERIAFIKKTNIRVTGFFLMGIPGEKIEDMEETVRFSKTLALDRVQFNNFMPLPGSELYDNLKAEGKLDSLNTDKFFVHDVAYTPEGVTEKDIKRLQRKGYLSFYLHPIRLMSVLRDVRSPGHLWRLVKRFLDGLK